MKIDLHYNADKEQTFFYLLQKITFEYKEKKYTIPKGFYSDGASVPNFFLHRCRPLDGRYITAFIKHDYGYQIQYAERKQIDQLLYDDLIQNGMDKITAYEIYIGVRLFGGSYWINDKQG